MPHVFPIPVSLQTPHELVVVKPAGLATELTTDPRGVSLIERVRRGGHPGARLPHRLDRLTRGFVVVALSDQSIAFHNAEIRAGRWAKWYLARVLASDDPGMLIGSHRVHLRVHRGHASVVRAGGKPARLDVLAEAAAPERPGQAHLLIRLHTGRFHQIRATLAHLGFPLAGDDRYGGQTSGHANPPYLEHAALRFRPYSALDSVTLVRPEDPDREPIEPHLVAALVRATERPDEESR
ncbi:MAG: RNA pseudouridine synthase [Candidatus Eisenbacteria bacterium]|uniref:RNA pseudouridine synthase n=1 Tax=Eiseniibacteriota bacterium TaxID=2212470 RepID=A0A956RQF1_UNCEI|nr:RNA pseudouridine synthase [Candidatus Eisenbacteria bacterium]